MLSGGERSLTKGPIIGPLEHRYLRYDVISCPSTEHYSPVLGPHPIYRRYSLIATGVSSPTWTRFPLSYRGSPDHGDRGEELPVARSLARRGLEPGAWSIRNRGGGVRLDCRLLAHERRPAHRRRLTRHASTRSSQVARLAGNVAWTLRAIGGGSESLAPVPACRELLGPSRPIDLCRRPWLAAEPMTP